MPPATPPLSWPAARRLGVVTLALAAPVWVVATVWRYGVDVPYWDQWELAPLVGRLPTVAEVWAPHSEHRIVFPRLVMLLLAWASGWDIRWELAASVIVALATYGALLAQARRTTAALAPGGALLPAVLSALSFSVASWENWLWGWQLQVFMCVGGAVGSLALLGRGGMDRRRFAIALGLATLATFSFGCGALVWPLGLLLLGARVEPQRSRRALTWCAVGAALTGLYLLGYAPPDVGRTWDPLLICRYVPIYLGAPLAPSSTPCASALGAVALLATPALAVVLVRSGRLSRGDVLPHVALAAFAVGSALLAASARAGLGLDQARESRYTTIALLLWSSLAVLLEALARPRADGQGSAPGRLTRLGARAAIAAIVALAISGSIQGRAHARARYRALRDARAALLRGGNDAELAALYPYAHVLRERRALLLRRRMSVFRDGR